MLLGFYGFLYATVIAFVSALEVSHQDLQDQSGLNGKVCVETGSCISGNASRLQFPKANCQCDDDCYKYGDCCSDVLKPLDAERQQRAVSEFRCVKVVRLYERGYENVSIYQKQSCPSNWTDVDTRQKCENSTRASSFRDPILITPVTNHRTNITYANIYCALCNRDASQFRDLIYWDSGLTCKNGDLTLDRTENKTCRETLRYDEKIASWQMDCDGGVFNCSIEIAVPNEVLGRIRPCVNTIKTCPATWGDEDSFRLKERCETYPTFVVYDNHDVKNGGTSQSYRNVYCGMCNHVGVHILDCNDTYHPGDVTYRDGFNPQPFAFLLDFRQQGACNESQRYDHFLKKCRDILPKVGGESCDNDEANCYVRTPVSRFKTYFNILTTFGIGLSIICLCIHLVVFCMFSELRNLPGKNLASLSFSLLVAYCSFMVGSLLDVTSRACFVNAIVTYYFFLAAFTWMLVMAFDVWRTLHIATTELRVSSSRQWRKFLIYSFCSWILPAKIVLISVLVELCPLTFVSEQFKPNFGQVRCWFGQGSAILLFFGVPLVLILVCNVAFFVHSAYMIYSTQSPARYTASPNTKRDFRLYLRLALIMGLTWITGVVAGFADNEILWVLFIVLNTSLGLFIFLAFTCKRKILHSIKNLKRKRALNLPGFSWTMNTSSDDSKTCASTNLSEKQTSNTYY